MNPVSIEKKLQMIRQIRQEYANNKNIINEREHILYGIHRSEENLSTFNNNSFLDNESFSYSPQRFIILRIVITILVTTCIIILDQSNSHFKTYSTQNLFSYIEKDYSESLKTNLFDFTKDIPYTTK